MSGLRRPDLPGLEWFDEPVNAGTVDLDSEASFVDYVFPSDRRAELFEILRKQKELITRIVDAARFTKETAAALLSLQKTVSTIRRYEGIQKVEGSARLIESRLQSDEHEKVAIFAIHRDVMEGLRVRLQKFKAVTVYGGTEEESRKRKLARFEKSKTCRAFIGNVFTCDGSVNLAKADAVYVVEPSWNPRDNAQAVMRVHNRWQTKNTNVYFIGLNGSIDADITHYMKQKTRIEILDF